MSAPFYENVCHYAFLGQFTYDVKKWICFCHPCPHLFYATDVGFSMQRPSLHDPVKRDRALIVAHEHRAPDYRFKSLCDF